MPVHNNPFEQFAKALVIQLTTHNKQIQATNSVGKIQLRRADRQWVEMDLTPFQATPKSVGAFDFFNNIEDMDSLSRAYYNACQALPFENSLAAAMQHLDNYAQAYVESIFTNAKTLFSDQDARRIASWVKQLDIYTAVKAVESLLNSQADLHLLKLAEQQQWQIHFDHLAIRCGSEKNHDAERIVELLIEHHGYSKPQMQDCDFYRFKDGWNAYMLYKMLENGQVLRLFIDQSDADSPLQVIQHWNRVYGYTAHHLAMRATHLDDSGQRQAIDLAQISQRLSQSKVECLTPTGEYTQGLLQQVFTRPERNTQLPAFLRTELESIDPSLKRIIENGKLLEIVSRNEVPEAFRNSYFALYGIEYAAQNPLHSVPIYSYFLPAQAAHVIKTSIQ